MTTKHIIITLILIILTLITHHYITPHIPQYIPFNQLPW